MGQPLGLVGHTLTLQTLFVVCHEHHFEELVGVVHEAGVNVIDVIAAPVAAGLATLTHTDKMAGAAVVDLGAETLSVAVFEDNKVISLVPRPCCHEFVGAGSR